MATLMEDRRKTEALEKIAKVLEEILIILQGVRDEQK